MMKYFNLFLGLVLLLCTGWTTAIAQKAEQKDGPKIVFRKTVHNYGTVKAGGDGIAVFEFKNTGNAPLVISNVTKSCGCITPDWTSGPVNPGETGEIKVTYDTHRIGVIDKYVTVASNAVNESVVALRVKGRVVGN